MTIMMTININYATAPALQTTDKQSTKTEINIKKKLQTERGQINTCLTKQHHNKQTTPQPKQKKKLTKTP